ncbi:tetratricopeptide repeat protein [Sphingomonas sp. CFBP 8765]|nr:tetratricopeptide repeat protein [Sphingomonas sp. CFBP 8765]
MISMRDPQYPLLRRGRARRRRRVFTRSHARLLAIALLVVAVAGTATLLTLRRDPPDARRLLRDARITLQSGNYSAARSNAQAAIAAAPSNGPAHVVLARALLELGDGLAAEAELTRARDAGIAIATLYPFQAQARLLQNDPVGAIEAADRAAPRQAAYARRIRAAALALLGNGAAARADLGRLVAEQPRDGRNWTALGRVALAIGDVGTAADAATRAVALLPDEPAALTLQGEIVRRRYGLVAALPWFERALARDAYYHPALIEYAATLGDAGRYRAMLAATRRAQRARPGSPQALYLQAVLAARAGRTELARGLLQKTGGAIDSLPGAILLSGALDYAEGRFEQAGAMWRGLARQQPLNVSVRRLLGAALLRSGDPRGAQEVLRPIVTRADADSYALVLFARAAAATATTDRERDAVAQDLDRANRGATGMATAFAIDDQVGTLDAAILQSPGDPGALLAAIRGRIQARAPGDALARARSLARASPGAPAAQLALGDTFAVTGRYADAVPLYARAADLSFDEPTMLRLVDALSRVSRQRQASTALALYLSQNPQSPTGQRILGHWHVMAGNWTAAIETLEAVRRRIGNRDAGLLTDLARAYAGAAPRDGADTAAVRYARAAHALAPMNAAATDAYGIALAGVGKLDGARQVLTKAVALAPGDRAIASHLAQLR